MRTLAVILSVVLVAGFVADVSAGTLGFTNITNNDPGDALIGETQLFVDIENGGPTVTFTFRNEGPEASVISEIYFDDGSLLGISSIIDNPPVVDFMEDANPPNLPGGDLLVPPFEVTEGFLAEASPSPSQNGVGPGESVVIMFDLINGGTLQDVFDELIDGTLRIGIHVIAFESGGSESFVNLNTGPGIPEPATLTLLGFGAVGFMLRRRRRV